MAQKKQKRKVAKKTRAVRNVQTKVDTTTSGTLYVRNIPVHVANKIRRQAKEKRQSIAGVIIELVEFASNSKYFTDENSH